MASPERPGPGGPPPGGRPSLLPDLEPRPGLQVRPGLAPALFLRHNLLLIPAGDLESALSELAAETPLLSVRPPSGRGAFLSLDAEGAPESAGTPSPEEILLPQLAACPACRDLSLAQEEALLSLLDPRGYLSCSEAEAARWLHLPEERLVPLLEALRDWVDPPGLFARDLAHCLRIQLRRSRAEREGERLQEGTGGGEAGGGRAGPGRGAPADRVDEWAERILTEGREELERGDRAGLLRRLSAPPPDAGNPPKGETEEPTRLLEAALARLRRLDPAPGRGLGAPAAPILPEVEFLLPEGSPGSLRPRVRLRREDLPSLVLTPRPGPSLSGREGRAAVRILTALALRRRNLMRLALLAAERQAPFLSGDRPRPAPLPLAEAANRTGLSLSTVWRLAGRTWALSPRGILRLATCFPAPLRARPDRTAEALRAEIREGWARGESDAALARRLGLPPRTVTYHRRAAGLPPARRRGRGE